MLASKRNETLYIGSTTDLIRRMQEHKQRTFPGFTEKYSIDTLVYFEQYSIWADARVRERRLKKWKREWKLKLIEERNPNWADLANIIENLILY